MSINKKYYLHKNWKFRQAGKAKWMKAFVPGTVHTDLMKNKLIGDPFYSDNERKLAWIHGTGWIYKTEFDAPAGLQKPLPVKLVFEGVDTVAKIILNGRELGRTDNMFLKYEFDIKKHLHPKNNQLIVEFESPEKFARAEEKKHGALKVALNSYRVHIRKAQYSFGWDWGPSFPTSGLWRDVYIQQQSSTSIDYVRFDTLEVREKYAVAEVSFGISRKGKGKYNAAVSLSRGNFRTEKTIEHTGLSNKVRIRIDNPDLWMPNGYGLPNLYDLEIRLIDGEDKIEDSVKKNVGVRKIELQLKENGKNTFRFVVNGKKIYAKGVNWIPGDAFLPRVKEAKYREILEVVRDANMNIVRVWGGGIYESDAFYGICDELGLMVWQDFMFACGEYPQHTAFIKNVEREITYNVKRLQHHPSIALWCGNNENEWIWYQEQNKSYKLMSGYKIYNSVIPALLSKLDPARAYWESSPFGTDEDPNSQSSGNRHQWNIWSRWIDYKNVREDNSLFVTEFGFQGPANISTFEKYIPASERKIHGEIFEFHNKQIEGPERVTRFLSAHLPLNAEWDEYIYLAQLNQGLALQTCLDHWRFNQPVTNGSIIWQINDTWPVTSWALMDSELRPKMSYHFVKRSFAPMALRPEAYGSGITVNMLNQTTGKFSGYLKIVLMKSASGKILSERKIHSVLPADSAVVSKKIKLNYSADDLVIVTLYNKEEEIVSRNVFAFKEWKYLKLPAAKIRSVNSWNGEGNSVILTSDKPAFFVDAVSGGTDFSDRGMIILPGEKFSLAVRKRKSLPGRKMKIRFYSLNQFLGE